MLGEFIKDKRLNLGMNQAEFSKAVDISVITVSNLENCNYDPSIKTLKKLSKFLKISIEELRSK